MSNKMPSVTVIILHYNEFALTKECTDSVLKSSYPSFDILIIDNGSKNNSYKLLQKKYVHNQKVSLVHSETNHFFAGGFNYGAKRAKGDYIILLSNDVVVEPDWINELVRCTSKNSKILVQPQILSYHEPGTIDNIGGHYTTYGIGLGIGHGDPKKDTKKTAEQIDYASATTFMINRSFFQELGMYDSWYRSHYEDVDLSLRAKKHGGECIVCYGSIIHHKGSVTYKKHAVSAETLLDVRKNRVRTIIKNFHGLEKIIRVSLCLLTFIPLTLQDLLSFEKNRSFLSLKAIYFAFFPRQYPLAKT